MAKVLSLWQGELPLGEAFWTWAIGIGLVVNLTHQHPVSRAHYQRQAVGGAVAWLRSVGALQHSGRRRGLALGCTLRRSRRPRRACPHRRGGHDAAAVRDVRGRCAAPRTDQTELVEFRPDGVAAQVDRRQRDRQPEPARARTARIEVEHAVWSRRAVGVSGLRPPCRSRPPRDRGRVHRGRGGRRSTDPRALRRSHAGTPAPMPACRRCRGWR